MRVSVITATWQRHDLLIGRCIPSVQAQTLRDFEHLVVSDGPDGELAAKLPADIRHLQLAEHLEPGWWGARSRNVGGLESRGEYIAFLDDDNAWRPDHLETLVSALDANPEASFAYGQMAYPQTGGVIGCERPVYGQIDSSMLVCRRSIQPVWPLSMGPLDWEMVAGWMGRGLSWVFVPKITVDYYFPWSS